MRDSGGALAEPAPAKINLALHVRRRRADGYHDLETLFAFARDGDTIAVAPAASASLTIDGPFAAGLGAGPDNLVARAAVAFCASEAVQIFGGAGFMRGVKVERIYREVKVNAIGGGTEEIMKDLASRQMGL